MFENLSGSVSGAADSATGFAGDVVDGTIQLIVSTIDIIFFKIAVLVPFPLAILIVIVICLTLLSAKALKIQGSLLFIGALVLLFCGVVYFREYFVFACPILQTQINDITSISWVGTIVVEEFNSAKLESFLTSQTLIIVSPVAIVSFLAIADRTRKTIVAKEIGFLSKAGWVICGFVGSLFCLWLIVMTTILKADTPAPIVEYVTALSWM